MFRALKSILGSFVLVSLLGGPVFGAAQLEPLTVGYSNITATYAPLWIAVEEQVGVKYGLDLKAIYAGRVRPAAVTRHRRSARRHCLRDRYDDVPYSRCKGPSPGGDDHE